MRAYNGAWCSEAGFETWQLLGITWMFGAADSQSATIYTTATAAAAPFCCRQMGVQDEELFELEAAVKQHLLAAAGAGGSSVVALQHEKASSRLHTIQITAVAADAGS